MQQLPRFDAAVAERFDEARALPATVVTALHDQVSAAADLHPGSLVLEAGAGTGALSLPFVQAGYRYVAFDTSTEMLAHFRAASPGTALLQADLASLPFRSTQFDLMLAIRVFGVVPGWRRAVRECARVLRPGGCLIVGRIERGPDSLHAIVRRERNRLLERMGIEARRPGADPDTVLSALAGAFAEQQPLPPIAWHIDQTPRDALERNLTGWRVQQLPAERQARLRQQLLDWLQAQCGPLDAQRREDVTLVLHASRAS